MNKSNSTRDTLIGVAKALIVERGFTAMSVSTVCTAAQVTKGSFFHHFSSKDELGAVVLDKFWADVLDSHSSAEYQQASTPLDAIDGYIEHAIKSYEDPAFGGCLLAVFTTELKDTHPDLYHRSVPYFMEWKSEVEELLKEAVRYCRPKEAFDAQEWAELYVSTVEGVLILSKAQQELSVIGRVLRLFREQLKRALSST
jgi:TetR/AcrR family transcriptional repressor of nem operon